MAFKSASRLARLLGLVVWPLVTAPAAAADLGRTAQLAPVRGPGVAAVPGGDRAWQRRAMPGRHDAR